MLKLVGRYSVLIYASSGEVDLTVCQRLYIYSRGLETNSSGLVVSTLQHVASSTRLCLPLIQLMHLSTVLCSTNTRVYHSIAAILDGDSASDIASEGHTSSTVNVLINATSIRMPSERRGGGGIC